MTREEAIKELRDASDSEVRYGDTENHYNEVLKRIEALDMAIKALKQTRWIPVSERLPEKEGLYLVSVKNDHQRRYSKTCYFSRKNWFARQDIIAWMPLPEPYKAESEV